MVHLPHRPIIAQINIHPIRVMIHRRHISWLDDAGRVWEVVFLECLFVISVLCSERRGTRIGQKVREVGTESRKTESIFKS